MMQKRPQQGLSLVEILVAVALGLLLVSAVAAQGKASKATRTSSSSSVGRRICPPLGRHEGRRHIAFTGGLR